MPRTSRPITTALLLAAAATAAQPQASTAAAPDKTPAVTLSQLKDTSRPLLIFAPSSQDSRLLDQLSILQTNQQAATDRDLVAVAIPETGAAPHANTLAPDAAAQARSRFHIHPGDFAVILIGKDGGEKLRSAQPIPFKRLRDVIDSMPMRQQEMKQKGGAPIP